MKQREDPDMSFPLVSMSISAPQIREEEFEKERMSLPEEEAQQARYEARGWVPIRRETEDMMERGTAATQEALAQMQRANEGASYREALERCPELVRTESDVVKFLRGSNYDPWAAAKRLALYWKARHECFGERSFLPMTQKEGALTEEDVAYLRDGNMRLMQEYDDFNRAVIYMRRGRIRLPERNVVMRCTFYLIAAASRDETVQRHGFVFVVDTTALDFDHLDRKLGIRMLHLLESAAPMRLRAHHVLYPSPRGVADLIMPMLLFLMGKEHRKRLEVHKLHSMALYESVLNEYGIREVSMPDYAGGHVSISANNQFLESLSNREN